MSKYFLITGLSNGIEIDPYMVETFGDLPYVIVNPPYGDEVRYYEELSEHDVIENMKKGIELF